MSETQLTEKAREERNRYQREWRAKNRDKCRAIQERYWLKRARMELDGREADGPETSD